MDRVTRIAIRLATEWYRFPRQRTFPFHDEPGWNRKPDRYIPEGYEPDEGGEYDRNVYHVTTNLRGVIQTLGLRSRRQLGEGVEGLGGGPSNQAPHLVSTTYSFQKARDIYNGFQYVLDVVRGEVRPLEIFNYIIEYYGIDEYDLLSMRSDLNRWVEPQKLDRELENLEKCFESVHWDGKRSYAFFQWFEDQCSHLSLNRDNSFEMGAPQMLGFTASYEAMTRLDPSQLAILQLAVRKDADGQHVPEEMEIRFRPEDLQVVRYLQP